MRRRLLLTVLAGLLAAGCESGDNPTDSDLSPAVHALAPGYSRIDLQMQDAWGVNDNGMIVGYVKGVGAWWYLGVRRSLPAPQLPWSSYYASNISEDNRISGAQAINGGAKYRALYWKTPTSSPIDLGDLGSGSAQAMDVNSHGILVGVSRAPYASNEWHAFRWENGVMADINPKGYFASSAMRINDDGVIVGFADMGTPQWHRDAIRWEPNGAITILQSTTNTLNSGAFGLNAMGDVSGQNPSFGPVVWFNGGGVQFFPSALGAQQARGLNDKYRMVGSHPDPTAGQKAWTSLKGVEMTLPVQPTESAAAADVNSCGWIVGWSFYGNRMTGTLWKPNNCD